MIEQIGKFIYIDDQASKYTEHVGATENEVSFMFFSTFSLQNAKKMYFFKKILVYFKYLL